MAGTLARPPEILDRLDVLFDPAVIAGARYTPGQMERIQTWKGLQGQSRNVGGP